MIGMIELRFLIAAVYVLRDSPAVSRSSRLGPCTKKRTFLDIATLTEKKVVRTKSSNIDGKVIHVTSVPRKNKTLSSESCGIRTHVAKKQPALHADTAWLHAFVDNFVGSDAYFSVK